MEKHELTISEAARKLGVSLNHVYSLVWAGKLNARKVKDQWRIPVEAVEARRTAKGE